MVRSGLFAAFALLATVARYTDSLNVCLYGVFGFLLKQRRSRRGGANVCIC